MNTNILIHKNSYSKIHSAISHSCAKRFENVRLVNLHDKIYDLALATNPTTIILQLEEYTQEFHQFIHDKSLPNFNIVITIDNMESRYNKFINLLDEVNKHTPISFKLLAPAKLYAALLDKGLQPQNLIGYGNVYNNYVFNKQDIPRNNKILCILDDNAECIDIVKPYLYPNTTKPIVMINNPNINYDQNIGLLFDQDISDAMNIYGAVFDLSKAYTSEIAVCGIPAYNIEHGIEWIKQEPQPISLETMPIDTFTNQISEYLV